MIRQSGRPADWIPALAMSLLVIWAPLPFGSVQEQFRTVLLIGVSLVALATAMAGGTLRGREFLVLVWVATIAAISTQIGETGPSAAVDAIDSMLAAHLSLRLGLLWVAMALAGGLVAAASRRRVPRLVLTGGVICTAALQILIAGQMRFSGEVDTIWRVSVAPAEGRLRGTFVNPDQLAFLLLLAIPLVLGFVLRRLKRGLREMTQRDRVLAAALLCLWLMLVIAVIGTGSRAALAVAVAVSLVQVWRPLRHVGWKGKAATLLVGVVLLSVPLLAAFQREGSALLRLSRSTTGEIADNARWSVYRESFGMWLERPLFGHGLGSFRDVFESRASRGPSDWWHAHSDPLELLAGVGLIGTVPVLVCWGWVLLRLLRAARVARYARSADRTLARALALSLVAGGLHSLVDFPLANPANALAYVTVLGIAIGLTQRLTLAAADSEVRAPRADASAGLGPVPSSW